MSNQIPRADSVLLWKARDDAEMMLVESVKRKTQEYTAKTQVEEYEVEARAYRIARTVFESEYNSALTKLLPHPLDRQLLAAIVNESKVVGHLMDESTAIFKKNLESQSQSP